MKHFFIIVDTSGSVASYDSMVAAINDLVRDMISELQSKNAEDIRVVTYANDAKIYWDSKKTNGFLDMYDDMFSGRSNLGKAYDCIEGIVKSESISMSDCALVLISDGEATDNYKKSLQRLDPKKEAYRVALSIGNIHFTTEKHVLDDELSFNGGILDRDTFIDRVTIFSQ